MPIPTGATFQGDDGVWYAYDDQTGEYVPAVSTPDQSMTTIPVSYQVVFDKEAPGLTEKITAAQKPGENWTDTWQRIASGLLMTVQQYKLIDFNTERAKKGLPPVDIASYSGLGVNIGLSPSTQQLLLFGGLAVAALLFFQRSSK
jgi:hypothetical protein